MLQVGSTKPVMHIHVCYAQVNAHSVHQRMHVYEGLKHTLACTSITGASVGRAGVRYWCAVLETVLCDGLI